MRILEAIALAFTQPDITLFKHCLETLEMLQSKCKLFDKVCVSLAEFLSFSSCSSIQQQQQQQTGNFPAADVGWLHANADLCAVFEGEKTLARVRDREQAKTDREKQKDRNRFSSGLGFADSVSFRGMIC